MEQQKTTKSSILIGHIGDVHLRDTQYATPKRSEDFFTAFLRAIKAGAPVVDIFVLCGDNFDNSRPSAKMIKQLIRADSLLRKLGKKMLAITGNHDYSTPTWLATLFPDRSTENSDGIIPMDDRSEVYEGFTFVGIPAYNAGKFRHNIAEIEASARGADVVLYHGFVDGVVPFYAGKSDPLRVDEFPISKKNKAWLLGDIHVQGAVQIDRPGGGLTTVAYPGSLEMCSSNEPQDKSLPVYCLSSEHMTLDNNIPLTTRSFIKAIVKTEDDLDALTEKLESRKDEYPLAYIEFSREVPGTTNRVYSILDAHRCVIKCFPLADVKVHTLRADKIDGEDLGVEHFVCKRFEADIDADLQDTALDLFNRGDRDGNNVVSEFVERRLALIAEVRTLT